MAQNKMTIRKGDTVKVIAGKDRGKTGKVLRSVPEKSRVVVEKVNMVKKAMRPTQANPQGGISTVEGAHSRVQQRDARVPQLRRGHPRGPSPRGRQARPRLQEVQQRTSPPSRA